MALPGRAEGVGFEPTVTLPPQWFSRPITGILLVSLLVARFAPSCSYLQLTGHSSVLFRPPPFRFIPTRPRAACSHSVLIARRRMPLSRPAMASSALGDLVAVGDLVAFGDLMAVGGAGARRRAGRRRGPGRRVALRARRPGGIGELGPRRGMWPSARPSSDHAALGELAGARRAGDELQLPTKPGVRWKFGLTLQRSLDGGGAVEAVTHLVPHGHLHHLRRAA